MKIFRFAKNVFSLGLTILSNFTNENLLNAVPLSCISMRNKSVKQDHKLLMLIEISLRFFHLILKQVNVVVVVIWG